MSVLFQEKIVHLSQATWAAYTGGVWDPSPPVDRPTGLSIDSRTLKSGDLFFAIHRPEFDAHDYIEQAFNRGAIACVVNQDYPKRPSAELPFLRVDDPNEALFEAAAHQRKSMRAKVVGITGSVGKTTVKELSALVLEQRGATAKTPGNYNNDFGLPISLLMTDPSVAYGVYEVGMNHPGELEPLCRLLQPEWGVMTPIAPVHIANFDSLEAIACEKAELFKALPSSGGAVISKDEPWYDRLVQDAKCRIITTSLSCQDADYYALPVEDEERLEVVERATGQRFSIPVALPGVFMRENLLLAAALGRALGVDAEQLYRAVEAYHPLKGRWERKRVGQVEVIDDTYNANPASTRASLEAFSCLSIHGKKWVVLGGMRELGEQEEVEHLALGRHLTKDSWAGLIAVGVLGRGIAEGAVQAGLANVITCADQKEAALALDALVQSGDVILLKASRGEKLETVLDYLRTD